MSAASMHNHCLYRQLTSSVILACLHEQEGHLANDGLCSLLSDHQWSSLVDHTTFVNLRSNSLLGSTSLLLVVSTYSLGSPECLDEVGYWCLHCISFEDWLPHGVIHSHLKALKKTGLASGRETKFTASPLSSSIFKTIRGFRSYFEGLACHFEVNWQLLLLEYLSELILSLFEEPLN